MSEWNWKTHPLKYDPSRGYLLCEPCWQGCHWQPPYKDANGVLRPKVANCRKGGCGCPCQPEFLKGKSPRFTGLGQQDLFESKETKRP